MSRPPINLARAFVLTLAMGPFGMQAHAEPVLPQSEAEVVETPARRGGAAAPTNASCAASGPRTRATRCWLPRWRGATSIRRARRASHASRVGRWRRCRPGPTPRAAPDDVLLMLATVQQFLHDFDGSTANLARLVARRPGHAQAWLTLATIRRVQGRYAESDEACRSLAAIATASVYARACTAENQSLRGEFDRARATLIELQASPRLAAATQAWLLTTLAESEARAGRATAAEKAYRAALRLTPDDYTALSLADFLMESGRHGDARAVLERLARTDAVVLRLAMAGVRLKMPAAARDAQEMRDRVTQANLRPQAQSLHAREQAMFALVVEQQPERALELARSNVALQREPIDLLLLAQAARAAGRPQALREAERLRDQMGLKDVRLDALL